MRTPSILGTGLCALALVLTGCGGGETKTEEGRSKAAPASAATLRIDPATAATVTGKVTFTGEKPVRRPISMDSTPACARAHTEPVLSEEAIVNDNGTLRNAFVWVKSGLPDGTWEVPREMVTIDQVGCIYVPHVVGVQTNQEVQFLNSDPTNHNIHPLPRANREWNESQPPKGEPKIKTFPKQEIMIPIKCNVHPWMRVYVGVVDHPFFAVTGEDGSFTLKGLPPGQYTVQAWHEKYGTQEIQVTVAAQESKTADFDFKG